MVLLHIRVFHTFQEQPLCRQGRPRLTAVAAGQDARDLFRLKGYSRQRIAQALRQKGIEPDTIEEVLEQFDAGESDARLRELIRKKYARYLGEEKGRQRAVNALLRMGYKYGEIRPALAEVLEELGVEEELDPED